MREYDAFPPIIKYDQAISRNYRGKSGANRTAPSPPKMLLGRLKIDIFGRHFGR